MDKAGYILLHKQITDNCLWTDKPFARGQAWIDLLLMANFKDGEMLCNGVVIPIKRGQVFRTIRFLSERWGWSIKKTKRFIKLLESQKMVTSDGLPQGTRITIEKYESFQTLGLTKEPTEGLSWDQPGTNPDPQKNKEIIKNNKKTKRGINIPPSLEEVSAYCSERNNGVDPQSFIDFYASKGWMVGRNKMKDWKASVRTWEKRYPKKDNNEDWKEEWLNG